ncbi:MAG: cobalt ABC transporter ATP-binding protein [Rhizobiales bacterium]|nr:cobalt ABC transporter ATP-binding protein [Hyphomicrobiales bacterium]MBA70746.1 cobalt ABC transporter ATP-binding protein [Hyphomicrobiales bacterium]|tara:strand:- start:308 stop:973 length:666 start_codon:yes stop_codon:yes gene_type:complete
MIILDNVSVEKAARRVLRGVSLELGERRIGVIGRNGSGKSTFARLLNGLEKPSSGSVRLAGGEGPNTLRRAVGFVFQNPDNQIVYPIVSEDLEFGLKNLKLPKDERRTRIDAALERFGISHLADRFTHELSGGEKQLVAMAGVLVMQPEMIVFDEPTTLLDLWNARTVKAAIDALDQHVVLVTHDLDLLADFDRVILIEAGAVAADGDPQTVIARYREQPA